MKVRIRIPEFTWRDAKGFHTVAHVGEVPETHPDIAAALKAGYLVPADETPAGSSKSKVQSPKSKEA